VGCQYNTGAGRSQVNSRSGSGFVTIYHLYLLTQASYVSYLWLFYSTVYQILIKYPGMFDIIILCMNGSGSGNNRRRKSIASCRWHISGFPPHVPVRFYVMSVNLSTIKSRAGSCPGLRPGFPHIVAMPILCRPDDSGQSPAEVNLVQTGMGLLDGRTGRPDPNTLDVDEGLGTHGLKG